MVDRVSLAFSALLPSPIFECTCVSVSMVSNVVVVEVERKLA